MRNLALQTLADQIAEDRAVSAEEALELRRAVFPDGIVSRDEAEILIAIAARVANTDGAWTGAFVEAITDHVLGAGPYPGHVDETSASWLMERFGREGPRETEIETLLKVLERSESAPEALSAYVRTRLAGLLAGAPVGAAETELVRRALYAASGSGAIAVTEAEARWLFALDAETAACASDASWRDLFVKALLNHLMGRRAPDLLRANAMLARQAWLSAPTPGVLGLLRGLMPPGWFQTARAPDGVAAWEQHYEARNAQTEADAALTLEEIAWTVGMVQQDGARTPNEEALLAAIRALEAPR